MGVLKAMKTKMTETFFNKINQWILSIKKNKHLTILSIALIVIIIVAVSATVIYSIKLKNAERLATTSEKNTFEDNENNQIPQISHTPDEDKIEKDEFIFPSEGKRPYAVMIDNEGTKCLPQGG